MGMFDELLKPGDPGYTAPAPAAVTQPEPKNAWPGFEWADDPLPPEHFPDVPVPELARWLGITRQHMYRLKAGDARCTGAVRTALLCLKRCPDLLAEIPFRTAEQREARRARHAMGIFHLDGEK